MANFSLFCHVTRMRTGHLSQMTPNVKCRNSGWIWHVTYDRSEKLLGYCLCLQLLPFETTKLSHWTKNYLGNSNTPFNWHIGVALLVILMELLSICHNEDVKAKQLYLYCFAFYFLSTQMEEQALRYTTSVEIRFLFFTNCCLNLNIEICIEFLLLVSKIAQKLFKFSL